MWKPTVAGMPPFFPTLPRLWLWSIINPIMREILMRCALESDFGVIIRAILPVVESWSWTEACSVAQSEKKKCCYACRSCSHLCLNQQLYIICFLLVRESSLTPLCLLGSTSPSDSSVWMMLWRLATFPGESRKWQQLKEQRTTDSFNIMHNCNIILIAVSHAPPKLFSGTFIGVGE